MGETNTEHRPPVSGIRIASGKEVGDRPFEEALTSAMQPLTAQNIYTILSMRRRRPCLPRRP